MTGLTTAIELCRQDLFVHPAHDLTLGRRRFIWSQLGPALRGKPAGIQPHRQRVQLACLSAQKVLPIWTTLWPDHHEPQHALDLVDDIMSNRMPAADGEREFDDLTGFMDEFASDQDGEVRQVAAGAGYAAVQALGTTLWDEHFDPQVVDLELTDRDVDPDEMDCSFFAAAAFAGGAMWNATGDGSKRLDFWRWWLDHAVPTAARIGA
jgi:hypothetical protein